MAQMVEHILGKDEVTGSIPVSSSKKSTDYSVLFSIIKSFLSRIYPKNATENKNRKDI